MSTAEPEDYPAPVGVEANAAAMKATNILVEELDPLDPLSYPDLSTIMIERQATVEFRAALLLLAPSSPQLYTLVGPVCGGRRVHP